MPLDSNPATAYEPKPGGLSDRARSVGPASNPPDGNTGGGLCHSLRKDKLYNKMEDRGPVPPAPWRSQIAEDLAQSTPPSFDEGKGKRSRAKKSSEPMRKFLDEWFYDALTLTMPSTLGVGTKSNDRNHADAEERHSTTRLMTWATLNGLHGVRVAGGFDGYPAGMFMGLSPVDDEPFAIVRCGHKTNMPGLKMSGGDGMCAKLAPDALEKLGPVLISRADVSLDVRREGLFDQLVTMCRDLAIERGLKAPRMEGTPEAGRTIYLGEGTETKLRIYEKGLERVARGKAQPGTPESDANLVRIEFELKAQKRAAKIGMAKLAREEGPGALLASRLWPRQFAERLAQHLGYAEGDEAILGVSRLEGRPEPRRVVARAETARAMSAGALIREAAYLLVQDQFEGDWLAAELNEGALVEKAIEKLRPVLLKRAELFVQENGLNMVQSIEEEAELLEHRLVDWLIEMNKQKASAGQLLNDAVEQARSKCHGAPGDPIYQLATYPPRRANLTM